jgi:putative acyl-CoA dehydrogenase
VARATELVGTIVNALTRADAEAQARAVVEHLAVLAATAALARSAPNVAAVFARTRSAVPGAAIFGTRRLDPGETTLLLERALPPN